jgi:serine protease Do
MQVKPFARSLAMLGLTTALAAGPLVPVFADAPPPALQVPSFAPIVDRVLPSVVNVSVVERNIGPISDDENDQAVPDEGPDQGMPGPGTPFDDFLRRFFEQNPRGIPMPGPGQGAQGHAMALGSGFIIDPAGYVVTNNHVVGQAEKVEVILQDGSRYKARIVGKDARTDLALLKVNAPKPLPALEWGDSDKAKVGDWVLAVGNPFGLGGTVTNGIVSARGRSLGDSSYVDYLQIDAPVNRGNSGGPTFDLGGHVIGITTAIYSPNGGNVGIAFSIPSDTARSVIEQLKSGGKVARGYLGVEVQEVTPALASALGLDDKQPKGALVAMVTPNGPAAKAGLAAGDVIQTFDGKTVEDMKALPRLVAETPSGKSVALSVRRQGKTVDLEAVIGTLPDQKVASAGSEGVRTGPLGVSLSPLGPEARTRLGLSDQVRGVMIARVAEDSPAAQAGLRAGDVIERVDGVAVSDPEQARQGIESARKSAKPVLLLIDSHGTERFVAIGVDNQG